MYVVSASLQDIVEVFAEDKSYGYNLPKGRVYGMRLTMDGDKYTSKYRDGYYQTQTKGKVLTINKYIKPKHNGQDPILVAGDSGGDHNMLTEYPGIKVQLLMKRKGKLDDVAKDPRALIQYRNEVTGLLDPEKQ